VTKIHFLPLQKLGSGTSQGHIITKKNPKMVVTLWIHSSRQVGYILENFKSFGIVQYIGKK